MFYNAIGYVVWSSVKYYFRNRISGQLKVGAGLALVTVAATAYLAARGDNNQE